MNRFKSISFKMVIFLSLSSQLIATKRPEGATKKHMTVTRKNVGILKRLAKACHPQKKVGHTVQNPLVQENSVDTNKLHSQDNSYQADDETDKEIQAIINEADQEIQDIISGFSKFEICEHLSGSPQRSSTRTFEQVIDNAEEDILEALDAH